MENVHPILNFIWSPGFRRVPLPKFHRLETIALSKVTVSGGRYDGDMQVTFVGHGNPARYARFVTGLREHLAPATCVPDDHDAMTMLVSFPLVSGHQRLVDQSPAQKAEVMMRYYLKLMEFCGVPYNAAPVPRIVQDFSVGRSATDVSAVPLGKHLIKKVLAEEFPHHRMGLN